MHRRKLFKSNPQATKLMKPSKGSFHHPAGFAQAAAVRGAPAGNLRLDTFTSEPGSQAVRIISPIRLESARLAQRRAAFAADRRHGLEQEFGLSDIVAIGLGQDDGNGNALRFREYVVLAARTTAIGWVRSTFFPAPMARIEELSAMTREKSSFSAPRSLLNKARCRRSHTRARCQALSRRQQVMPEPQPISWGNICHGMPERSTNRIPLNTWRSLSGSRPVCCLRRFFLGNSGSICFHSSSSTSGAGMA